MRIWSLHPEYLDAKGLVALWRESLLARHVLEGRTKGYINHPQLLRFKAAFDPMDCINQYLASVYQEASARGYHFDKKKIDPDFVQTKLPVTKGQLEFEKDHLLAKLKARNEEKYQEILLIRKLKLNPLFYEIEGEIEDWEKK